MEILLVVALALVGLFVGARIHDAYSWPYSFSKYSQEALDWPMSPKLRKKVLLWHIARYQQEAYSAEALLWPSRKGWLEEFGVTEEDVIEALKKTGSRRDPKDWWGIWAMHDRDMKFFEEKGLLE